MRLLPKVLHTLRAFAAQQATQHEVMRAVIQHDDWLVPVGYATQVLGRLSPQLLVLGDKIAHPANTLLAFTDVDSAIHAHEAQGLALGPFVRGIPGVEVFSALAPGLEGVVVNEGAPTEDKLYLRAPSFGNAAVWADVVGFEADLAAGGTTSALRLRVRDYDAYFIAVHPQDGSIVTIRNYPGLDNAGLVFTAPDCLAAFMHSVPSGTAGLETGEITGERLLHMLPDLGVDGIVINACGPGVTRPFTTVELEG